MIAMDELEALSKRPRLYERKGNNLWDDEHISQKMLEAHLDPDWEAASRCHRFMDQSAAWLGQLFSTHGCRELLDLGCGPGLYSERLTRLGFQVTGLDISRRSIAYAREQAQQKRLAIEYHCCDYLNIDERERFDAAVLIYCDFGALTRAEAERLVQGVYGALRPGGLWVLDVFRPAHRSPDENGRKSWGVEREGFWNAGPHLFVSETFYYPEAEAYLDQTFVLQADGCWKAYRIWETVFAAEILEAVFAEAGFSILGCYGDVAGGEAADDGTTLALVLQKPGRT